MIVHAYHMDCEPSDFLDTCILYIAEPRHVPTVLKWVREDYVKVGGAYEIAPKDKINKWGANFRLPVMPERDEDDSDSDHDDDDSHYPGQRQE